jgi:hypothetical protein
MVTRVGVSLSGAGLLLEELLVADGGQGGCLVNNGSDINPLVNGDDLVDSSRSDGFSLDNGLD